MFEAATLLSIKLFEDSTFQLRFDRNWDLPPVISAEKTKGVDFILSVGRHLSVHMLG